MARKIGLTALVQECAVDRLFKSIDVYVHNHVAEATAHLEHQEEDEDDSLNVSLAAMEEKLKPKVLNDFNDITNSLRNFKKVVKN